MARFVIENKIYNTEKMTLVGHVKKWYKFTGWLITQIYGKDVGMTYDCTLYKSEKGNWLLVHKGNCRYVGEAISESEAKRLLLHYDYESYAKEYGELEEA